MTPTQALQTTHSAIKWLLGPFSKAQNGWDMKPNTFPNLAPRCRLHETIGSIHNLAQNNFTYIYIYIYIFYLNGLCVKHQWREGTLWTLKHDGYGTTQSWSILRKPWGSQKTSNRKADLKAHTSPNDNIMAPAVPSMTLHHLLCFMEKVSKLQLLRKLAIWQVTKGRVSPQYFH
jgi:hypothetical protein